MNFISIPLPLGFLMCKQSQGFQSIHVLPYPIVPHVTKTSIILFHYGFSLNLQKIALFVSNYFGVK
jgi:hypothetical protein